MNDKEMLELAARAAKRAGMNLLYGKSIDEQELQWHCDFAPWNPLTDDGDALRLAAKLSIGLHWCKSGRVYAYHDDVEAFESSREYRQSNLRRAITRAAAEIGRSM